MSSYNILAIAIFVLLIYYILREIYIFYKKWLVLRKIPTFTEKPKWGPILGNFSIILKDPVELYRFQHRTSIENYPIFKIWILGLCLIVITDLADLKVDMSLNKNEDDLTFQFQFLLNQKHKKIQPPFKPWLGDGLFSTDGDIWAFKRKLLQPFFHPGRFEYVINIFNEECMRFLDDELKPGIVDVNSLFTQLLFDTFVKLVLGEQELPVSNETFHSYFVEELHFVTKRFVNPCKYHKYLYMLSNGYRKEKKLLAKLNAVFDFVIENHSNKTDKCEGGSLLNYLLEYNRENGTLDQKDLREELTTAIFGGYDNSSIAMTFVLMFLANNPEVQDKVYNEILQEIGENGEPTVKQIMNLEYTECCLNETMRMYPPAPLLTRNAAFPFVTKTGYEIPEGIALVLHLGSAQYSPKYYDSPEQFKPERFLNGDKDKQNACIHMGYSYGRRTCIGKKISQLGLKCILCNVLRKYKLEPVDHPDRIQICFGVVTRFKNGVRVKFVPRN